jgi:hypothetical protein
MSLRPFILQLQAALFSAIKRFLTFARGSVPPMINFNLCQLSGETKTANCSGSAQLVF